MAAATAAWTRGGGLLRAGLNAAASRTPPRPTGFGFMLLSRTMASVSVHPPQSQVDDAVDIRVSGLPAQADVTLHLNMTNRLNLNFDSFHRFRIGECGTLDLNRDRPVGETYTTLDPMSLFRTLKPRSGFDPRFWSMDTTAHFDCRLNVYDRPVDSVFEAEALPAAHLLASAQFQRRFVAPGVRRIEVKTGRLRGTLYLPPDEYRPFRPVMTLHGGILRRRVVEDVAATLAGRGFAVLALAYFGVDNLPKLNPADPLDLTYFEEAIDYLYSLDGMKPDGGGVGIWSISKGSEIALALSHFLPNKIRAVVSINGSLKLFAYPIVYKDQRVECVDMEKIDFGLEQLEENVYRFVGFDVPLDESLFFTQGGGQIPFADSPASFLFVAGDDDSILNTPSHAQLGVKLLMEAQGPDKDAQLVIYPGMGHMVDVPYAPPIQIYKHMLLPKPALLFYGGNDVMRHSAGQEDAWRRIVHFFQTRL